MYLRRNERTIAMTGSAAAALERRYGPAVATSAAAAGLVGAHPALATILARRTIRDYADRPVSDDLIDALLDIAFSAPSKSDYQQATVLRVVDAEKRKAMAALVPAMPWIGTAPAFLVFCADARRLERVCALRGKPKPNRDLEAFFNASVDAALVLQTFILAATQVGLGCCPISHIRFALDRAAAILGLPELVIPVAGLTLGYPATEGFVSMRLPPSLTRAVDRYDDRNLAAEVDAYDRRREQRHPTPREKQRAVASFGHAATYGWSEDKARHAAASEGEDFGAMVRRRGFTLD
jgi:nitroreductase